MTDKNRQEMDSFDRWVARLPISPNSATHTYVMDKKDITELFQLIKCKEREAYEKAKMELEVEIGLQKFGQLIKEKEKIQREAIEGFINRLPNFTEVTDGVHPVIMRVPVQDEARKCFDNYLKEKEEHGQE